MIPEDIFFTSEFTEVAKLEDSSSTAPGLVSEIFNKAAVWPQNNHCWFLFMLKLFILFCRTAFLWWTSSLFIHAVHFLVSGAWMKATESFTCVFCVFYMCIYLGHKVTCTLPCFQVSSVSSWLPLYLEAQPKVEESSARSLPLLLSSEMRQLPTGRSRNCRWVSGRWRFVKWHFLNCLYANTLSQSLLCNRWTSSKPSFTTSRRRCAALWSL